MNTALHECARHNSCNSLNLLMQLAKFQNTSKETALMIAAAKNNVQIVRALVSSEAKMTDCRGFTALMYAAANDALDAC